MTDSPFAIYLVTDTALCGGPAAVAGTVAGAVSGGASAVQLRDPVASTRQLVELARALQAAIRDATAGARAVPLIINDRVDVALAVGADGAHVGQTDLDPILARELLGPARHLGLSVSSDAELAAALALPHGTVDLLGVGPIRPTASKPDAAAPIGFDGLTRICASSSLPCVAIGGVGEADIAELLAAGAVGMAVISAICGTADPAAAAARLALEWVAARQSTPAR